MRFSRILSIYRCWFFVHMFRTLRTILAISLLLTSIWIHCFRHFWQTPYEMNKSRRNWIICRIARDSQQKFCACVLVDRYCFGVCYPIECQNIASQKETNIPQTMCQLNIQLSVPWNSIDRSIKKENNIQSVDKKNSQTKRKPNKFSKWQRKQIMKSHSDVKGRKAVIN